MCRKKPVDQLRRLQRKTPRSAAVARVPRQITSDALKRYTGMRVDTDAVSCVDEM